ncbi:MAG: DUF1648 domain-containing protein [Eggerthellaceae bacterium]|nr:DUF1648 domain-containing protein [Eggerthellaceae bacterium]
MSDTSSAIALMLLTSILVPIVGVMLAITPYLMKKSEVFAVTVPESALFDPYLKGLKKRYLWVMLLITVVLTALCFVFALMGKNAASIAMMVVGMLALLVVGYGLMLYFRSKVRAYKKQQNWEAIQQEAVAVLGAEEAPRAISLKWNLLYIPVLLITLAIGAVGYASMPDMVPIHTGLNGVVNGYAPKTPMIVVQTVLIQAFLALCFVFSHWMIIRAKRQASPSAPATSSLAYGMFARAQSVYLVALGLIMCILMIAMPLSFIGVMTLLQAGLFCLIGALIAVIGALAIAVVYGQGGSRVFARMQAADRMPADDDRFWKLGVFYYNPQDPSLFLLERFGVGWTVNFARPAVGAIIVGFIVATIAFVVAMALLV